MVSNTYLLWCAQVECKTHACSVLSTRCVICCDCGATTPGVGCQWMSNYTQCGPCASKTTCPVCKIKYNTNDLMIQCTNCERYTQTSYYVCQCCCSNQKLLHGSVILHNAWVQSHPSWDSHCFTE